MRTFKVILFLCLLWSCNKKNKESSLVEPVPKGIVTEEEIKSLQPLSLQQMKDGHDYVLKETPALAQDTIAFSRAIFNRLKTNPNGKIGALSGVQETNSFISIIERLKLPEMVVLITRPFFIKAIYEIVSKSEKEAMEAFPCEKRLVNNKADAVRHAFWNALMVKHISFEAALEYSEAHELGSKDSHESHMMDYHNNKIGRNLALRYPSATDEQLLEMLIAYKFLYVEPGSDYPDDAERALIYFESPSLYDGVFVGILRSRINALPSIFVIQMTQCDEVVRGTILIGKTVESLQEFRFKGVYNVQDNSMALFLRLPFEFEVITASGTEISNCSNVQMFLNGNEYGDLVGSWESSTCSGGSVELYKK